MVPSPCCRLCCFAGQYQALWHRSRTDLRGLTAILTWTRLLDPAPGPAFWTRLWPLLLTAARWRTSDVGRRAEVAWLFITPRNFQPPARFAASNVIPERMTRMTRS